MNNNAKILYICQEAVPYLPENDISALCRHLPQAMQERGAEIRIFMPRWGCINERRNQLHEVIRLSGMNLIIDDTDHQLIIKVASIPSARVQVYFIDNEDFFKRNEPSFLPAACWRPSRNCAGRRISYTATTGSPQSCRYT